MTACAVTRLGHGRRGEAKHSRAGPEAVRGAAGGLRRAVPSRATSRSHAQGEGSRASGLLPGPPGAPGGRVSAEPLEAGFCLAAGEAVRGRVGCGQRWRLAVRCLPLQASVKASEETVAFLIAGGVYCGCTGRDICIFSFCG